jgi:hypothetical protein
LLDKEKEMVLKLYSDCQCQDMPIKVRSFRKKKRPRRKINELVPILVLFCFLNFIGFSLITKGKLKHFRRISGETADNLIKECERFFANFEKPEVVKIDNGFAMAGVPLWPRVISKVPLWLLKERITPIFTPPKKALVASFH